MLDVHLSLYHCFEMEAVILRVLEDLLTHSTQCGVTDLRNGYTSVESQSLES